MTAPVALMRIGGNPDKAPAVMKHNADALLDDRDKLIRWQAWYKGKPSIEGLLLEQLITKSLYNEQNN